MRPHLATLLVLLASCIALAEASATEIHLRLDPMRPVVAPGEEFTLELKVDEGPSFNGYDLRLTFDPAALQFMEDAAQQEGALFTTACTLRYHVYSVTPDSSEIDLSHILLCAGTSVEGPGTLYRFRFRARDVDAFTPVRIESGTSVYFAGSYVTPLTHTDAWVTVGTPTATSPGPRPPRLHATPNPFNPTTVLAFELSEATRVDLTIYRADGRRVRRLLESELGAGHHEVHWRGRDDAGRPVASGVYLARLGTSTAIALRRLVLIR